MGKVRFVREFKTIAEMREYAGEISFTMIPRLCNMCLNFNNEKLNCDKKIKFELCKLPIFHNRIFYIKKHCDKFYNLFFDEYGSDEDYY